MKNGPFRDSKVHVLEEKCSTCVFRPGNKMHLEPGRVKDLLDQNIAAGGALQCHQTLEYASDPRPPAICRGFWDHPRSVESQAVRMAKRMPGVVEYDKEETSAD